MSELKHYGVIGMKWGVRRGNTAKAYEKASKKLNKLDNKLAKKEAKAVKQSNKADKKQYSVLSTSKRKQKAVDKATKAATKAARRAYKADKWYKAMEETFANTKMSLTKEQVAMGKKYADIVRSRSIGRY